MTAREEEVLRKLGTVERFLARSERSVLKTISVDVSEAIALIEELRGERDAVRWIGVVREELVAAGFPSGDRDVALASIRSLLRERDKLREALQYARPLLVKYAYTQGNRPDFVREITAPIDRALSLKETAP